MTNLREETELLLSIFDRLVEIPPAEREYFRTLVDRRSVPAQSHFARAGEPTADIGFCLSGLFRLYYTTPDGTDYNKNFCGQNEFVASYSSLLMGEPSYFSIQALMDSELLVVRFRDFEALFDRHACWGKLGRLIAQHMFVSKERRERELLMLSAEERYRQFLGRYKHLENKVPQYHIASYLGITPVALSRIRGRLT
ncbi:Crp/Fnr family transcriptional regulator [Cohnella sp. GCM10027633]|uniref:Crp/Fnr family transcriptional regulator n=1 Tax=unclassified Cohnella TaxID=2636738 RepID=UPI003635CF05